MNTVPRVCLLILIYCFIYRPADIVSESCTRKFAKLNFLFPLIAGDKRLLFHF
jgi:hypothetical protein